MLHITLNTLRGFFALELVACSLETWQPMAFIIVSFRQTYAGDKDSVNIIQPLTEMGKLLQLAGEQTRKHTHTYTLFSAPWHFVAIFGIRRTTLKKTAAYTLTQNSLASIL